jgi:hypothetical protein
MGFVETAKAGGFSFKQRHAAEYRLTLHTCDVTGATPTKAFMHRIPNSFPGPTSRTRRSDHGDTRNKITTYSPTAGTVEVKNG